MGQGKCFATLGGNEGTNSQISWHLGDVSIKQAGLSAGNRLEKEILMNIRFFVNHFKIKQVRNSFLLMSSTNFCQNYSLNI